MSFISDYMHRIASNDPTLSEIHLNGRDDLDSKLTDDDIAPLLELLMKNPKMARQITLFNFSHNKLTELDASMFQHFPNLTRLFISYNQIKTVDAYMLSQLPKTVLVCYSGNPLTDSTRIFLRYATTINPNLRLFNSSEQVLYTSLTNENLTEYFRDLRPEWYNTQSVSSLLMRKGGLNLPPELVVMVSSFLPNGEIQCHRTRAAYRLQELMSHYASSLAENILPANETIRAREDFETLVNFVGSDEFKVLNEQERSFLSMLQTRTANNAEKTTELLSDFLEKRGINTAARQNGGSTFTPGFLLGRNGIFDDLERAAHEVLEDEIEGALIPNYRL